MSCGVANLATPTQKYRYFFSDLVQLKRQGDERTKLACRTTQENRQKKGVNSDKKLRKRNGRSNLRADRSPQILNTRFAHPFSLKLRLCYLATTTGLRTGNSARSATVDGKSRKKRKIFASCPTSSRSNKCVSKPNWVADQLPVFFGARQNGLPRFRGNASIAST